LPICTDFKKAAPEGFSEAWKAIKNNLKEPFGRFNAAALMRIKEAKLTDKNLARLLRDNRITPEMADFIKALPIDRVFAVNQMLCCALSERVKGKGKNAFLPIVGLNEALSEFDLPPMPEPVSK